VRYLTDRITLGEEAVEELMAAVEEGTVSTKIATKVLKELPEFKKLREELEKIKEKSPELPTPVS